MNIYQPLDRIMVRSGGSVYYGYYVTPYDSASRLARVYLFDAQMEAKTYIYDTHDIYPADIFTPFESYVLTPGVCWHRGVCHTNVVMIGARTSVREAPYKTSPVYFPDLHGGAIINKQRCMFELGTCLLPLKVNL